MNRTNLKNSVALCTEKTDKFKKAVISVNIAMPLDERVSARAILPYLLCRSNRDHQNELDFSRTLAKLYGAQIVPSVKKSGETQIVSLTLYTIDDRFALGDDSLCKSCMKLLCECIFEPYLTDGAFPVQSIEREKRLLIERIKGLDDEKRLYAKRRLEEEMCRYEAFCISPYGTVKQAEILTVKGVVSAWKEMIARGVFQINVVGSADGQEILDILASYLPADRQDVQLLHTEFVTAAYDTKRVEETQRVKQSKIAMGFRVNMTYEQDNLGALLLVNSIFGGDVHSKLFTNVREKQSLCYYCSSALDRYKGIMTVQCGVETENIQKAIDSVLHELDDIKAGCFTEEDIRMSVMKLKDALHCVYDSPETLDAWFKTQIGCAKFLSPDALAALCDGVSKEEIIIAANDITLDTVFVLKADGTDENEQEDGQ